MRSRLQGHSGDVQRATGAQDAGKDNGQAGGQLEGVEELREVQHGGAWRVVYRDATGLWRALRYAGRGWGAPTPEEAATDAVARAYRSRRAARRAGQLAAGVAVRVWEATAVHPSLGRVVRRFEARTERQALRTASRELAAFLDGWTWRLWRVEDGTAGELAAERTGGARHWRRTGGAS